MNYPTLPRSLRMVDLDGVRALNRRPLSISNENRCVRPAVFLPNLLNPYDSDFVFGSLGMMSSVPPGLHTTASDGLKPTVVASQRARRLFQIPRLWGVAPTLSRSFSAGSQYRIKSRWSYYLILISELTQAQPNIFDIRETES